MLDKKVVELLNQQVNSAYLYLDFSNYYYDQGLTASETGTRSRRRRSATMRF